MSKAIGAAARRLAHSVPAMALLLVAAGVGVGYAADSGGDGDNRGDGDRLERAPGPGGPGAAIPFGENLSDEDRQALEGFHQCLRDRIGEPGERRPPDPEQLDRGFEQCSSELPGDLRQDFEQRHQEMQAFRDCMQEHAVEPPGPGNRPPSEEAIDRIRRAHEACADELPEGGGPGLHCIGPGPGPGGPGSDGGPGAHGFSMPAPPTSGGGEQGRTG